MRRKLWLGLGLMAAFALWTWLLGFADVQAIGPLGSSVGFAALNGFVHRLTGVHMTLYHITDWLGFVPLGFAFGFAILGLAQWIRRKDIRKVDRSILVLGGFYLVVIAAYLLFEAVVVNRRPVLINGYLEASYPSSTTLLTFTVMPTAILQLTGRIRNGCFRHWVKWVLVAFTAFMVAGRLISGVHWVTDIVGASLFSAGLVLVYDHICKE